MPDVDDLIQRGDQLFSKRSTLMTHWQDIAEQFYPQRADFTAYRILGEEFADHLNSSYPILVHREMSSAIASMLRKRDTQWFRMDVEDNDDLDIDSKRWLEWATKRQRRAMYDNQTQFVRATTEGDADFSAFGQCAISNEINWNARQPHVLYRSWHLRDVAWCEGYDQKLSQYHIRWKPEVQELKRLFPGKLHHSVEHTTDKEKYRTVECRRVILMEEDYEMGVIHPWVIVYIDMENKHVMDRVPLWQSGMTLPRWQTVSGSQYAYSPATVAGLPEARLLQSITLTLLEAGEMYVRPPLVATDDVIREDVQWYAGGITWVDKDYDERLGDPLRPISQDRRGFPIGTEMSSDARELLSAAFFLNKLTLPPAEKEMTATEVRERIQEYIRGALPLFEPMETQYNAPLCENTFEMLLRAGFFGPPQNIPRQLQGRDIEWKFISPLHDAVDREESITFQETAALLAQAAELDPSAAAMVDVRTALHDALDGIKSPAKWRRTEDEVKRIMEEQRQAAAIQQAAEVAEQAGRAGQEVAAAEQVIDAA